MNEIMIAVLAGLGGMLGWGFADFFAKKAIDKAGDITSLAWGHIFGSITFIGILSYQFLTTGNALSLPTDASTWSALLLFGIAQAAVYLFVYIAFGKGQLSILSPIFASFAGITALLSILIFGEVVTLQVGLGLAVLFTGIMLISLDFSALRSLKLEFTNIGGVHEIAIATIMAALWTLFWGRYLAGEDWLSYTFVMYLSMTLATIFYAYFRNISLTIKDNAVWLSLILIGVCEMGAYLAISIGYSLTSALSVVAVLSGAFSLPAIILAFVFLKERVSLTQGFAGLVIIAGIMLLSTL